MRKIIRATLILSLVVLLTGCVFKQGKSANAKETIGQSEKFAKKEIEAAIDEVKKEFNSYKGCELTSIWYDETRSNHEVESYMESGRGSENGVKPENVIVLLSDYTTGDNAGDGSLNPNSEYEGWMWILIRNSQSGNWRVDDRGH